MGMPAAVRAALGYHRVQGETASVRAYSRDRLEYPISLLIQALEPRVKPSLLPTLYDGDVHGLVTLLNLYQLPQSLLILRDAMIVELGGDISI